MGQAGTDREQMTWCKRLKTSLGAEEPKKVPTTLVARRNDRWAVFLDCRKIASLKSGRSITLRSRGPIDLPPGL